MQNNNSNEFKNRLNSDLDFCGFSQEVKLGFLFLMGACIQQVYNDTALDKGEMTNDQNMQNLQKVINLYDTPHFEFEHYGDLNDMYLNSILYTYSVLFHEVLTKADTKVNEFFRRAYFGPNNEHEIIPLSTHINEDFFNEFKNLNFSLSTINRMNYRLFEVLGEHVLSRDYDEKKAYGAGVALFNLNAQVDIKGAFTVMQIITNFPSPVFKALLQYPLLFVFAPEALRANHLFSSILQMFYGSYNQGIVQPVHKLHQMIYYTPGSIVLREMWDFKHESAGKLYGSTFLNAIQLRNKFPQSIPYFLNSNEIHMDAIKNREVSNEDLFEYIPIIIKEKYGIELQDLLNPKNTADKMMYTGIFFYETCLHSMIVNKII